MINPIHPRMASGAWHAMSLCEQLGNIGSEISRARRALESDNQVRKEQALLRALELFDLTIDDPKHRHTPRLREICRAREVVCDLFFGDNEYRSTADSLDRYFTAYALAAQVQRGR